MFMHMKMMISAYTLENASVPILQDRPSVIPNAKTGEGLDWVKSVWNVPVLFLITA